MTNLLIAALGLALLFYTFSRRYYALVHSAGTRILERTGSIALTALALFGLGAIFFAASLLLAGGTSIPPRLAIALGSFLAGLIYIWALAVILVEKQPSLSPWAQALAPVASAAWLALLVLWSLAPQP